MFFLSDLKLSNPIHSLSRIRGVHIVSLRFAFVMFGVGEVLALRKKTAFEEFPIY